MTKSFQFCFEITAKLLARSDNVHVKFQLREGERVNGNLLIKPELAPSLINTSWWFSSEARIFKSFCKDRLIKKFRGEKLSRKDFIANIVLYIMKKVTVITRNGKKGFGNNRFFSTIFHVLIELSILKGF